jgi:hypothetical protein
VDLLHRDAVQALVAEEPLDREDLGRGAVGMADGDALPLSRMPRRTRPIATRPRKSSWSSVAAWNWTGAWSSCGGGGTFCEEHVEERLEVPGALGRSCTA